MLNETQLKNLFHNPEHNNDVLAIVPNGDKLLLYFRHEYKIYSIEGQYIDVQGNRELFIEQPKLLSSQQVANLVINGTFKVRL